MGPGGLVGTHGNHRLGPRLPRPGRIIVRFGAPLRFAATPGSPSGRLRRTVTDEIMARIGELSGQEPADAYNALSAGS